MSKVNVPVWFWIAAILGLIWNLFGVFQFQQSVVSTQESLLAMGLTEAQANVMLTHPVWMTVAFALGTFGGLIGSVLLLFRKKQATFVFALSLAGYVLLYIGDITEGVFAALGAIQVAILTSVVLIAAGLLWLSRAFQQKGHLA